MEKNKDKKDCAASEAIECLADEGQIKAQALILDEAEAAHCRSPFNA